MIPRLDISFPFKRQLQFWFGQEYIPKSNELLLNYARSGIVLSLRACLPNGGNVGVIAYNCHTVANAVVNAGCTPVFLDVNEDLTLDIFHPNISNCKAIVVTNLFGIRNDINAIRQKFLNMIIIVDNAHGYGLPPEGDFTVYSINQGKYPALGPGGILVVNNSVYQEIFNIKLPKIKLIRQFVVFLSMLIKAFLYIPFIYGCLTVHFKKHRTNQATHGTIKVEAMCSGVSRLYNHWLIQHSGQNVIQPFMDIIYTNDVEKYKKEYKEKGIESDTHFKYCIEWAKEFGYSDGSCPTAERLVNQLLMVPNYYKYK